MRSVRSRLTGEQRPLGSLSGQAAGVATHSTDPLSSSEDMDIKKAVPCRLGDYYEAKIK